MFFISKKSVDVGCSNQPNLVETLHYPIIDQIWLIVMCSRRKIRMKKIVTLILISIALAGCRSTVQPPEGAKTIINFKSEANGSPYWESIMDKFIIQQINRHAGYELVAKNNTLPFTLAVNLISSSSKEVGRQYNSFQAVTMYQSLVEGEAKLYDQNHQVKWTWSGWAKDKSDNHAIEELGAVIGRSMRNEGLVNPAFYK